jgi:UDP-N-acetylmuramate--alanine ligase
MNTLTHLPASLAGSRVHFIGIKGTGMAALTEIFQRRGAKITGSDVGDLFYTDAILRSLGITPTLFDAAAIAANPDFVVYSAAYTPAANVELAEVERRNIPAASYPQALGLLSRRSFSAGIAGVHGKTTTAGMAGTLLGILGVSATTLAGSAVPSFGGRSTWGSGERFFVAETCEYRRHFMNFSPQVIVLTSVESDHQDFFPTYADIRRAFVDYCLKLPQGGTLIFCADDPGASETAGLAAAQRPDLRLIPYGENAPGEYRVTFGDAGEGRQYFRLDAFDRELFLRVPGRHLVLNAAAACALAVRLAAEEDPDAASGAARRASLAGKIAAGLEAFTGAKRRSEIIGQAGLPGGRNVVFVDDYAHHPTAIARTLEGYREFFAGRAIVVDFMSHTYSRTLALLDDFSTAFSAADTVVLHKIYPSAREAPPIGESPDETLVRRVAARHRDVRYVAEHGSPQALALARELVLEAAQSPQGRGGVLFVTMGAGDNWKLGGRLLADLGRENGDQS